MLCLILIVGGLLIMMGQHDRSEALFYYFRLEDQVPENHLLRLIEKHISFEFVREQLKDSYSETGRPSIDPELLLRILLIGYLYGVTSERKLVEELRMHLAWRWFTGLGFDQEIPHHSTFSKNRHGRFQESKLFEQLFEQIVKQCVEVGLVQGKHLSVDGSFVEANAAKGSRIPMRRASLLLAGLFSKVCKFDRRAIVRKSYPKICKGNSQLLEVNDESQDRDGDCCVVHDCGRGRPGYGRGHNKNHPQENADTHRLSSERRGCQ